MSYQVSLEVFEGPFDLLLQLIARKKLDVTEVGLAEITADFLAYLTDLDDLDLETATRFLVVAATLIELKAARLLPAEERQELEDLLGEARDLLYARLLEYRAFRDVARILSHRLVQHEAHLSREVAPESWIGQLVPDAPLPIDAEGLAALAAAATTPEPEPTVDLSHIRRSYVSIREAALTMLSTLPASGVAAPFRELVEGRDRGDRVVFFLALLELFKLGHVGLEQPDHRGPLGVTRTLGGRDLASVVDELNDDEPDDEPADDAPADDTPTDDTAAPAPTGASS
ncbi:segregation/condensation protein A [Nitriliruptoraceae bacterium ZYF776]|nr:segregation/condensation protein A [Profundirhabdus halotolerans]